MTTNPGKAPARSNALGHDSASAPVRQEGSFLQATAVPTGPPANGGLPPVSARCEDATG